MTAQLGNADCRTALTQSFTEEKKGLDFSPRSGEATSGEKKIPHESRVACHE